MPVIQLTARDGHTLQAYCASPPGQPRGGVVVVQEIFGVNEHIRAITDDLARNGYLAVAPGLFDRIRPGIEMGYDPASIEAGRALVAQLSPQGLLDDMAAAIAEASKGGRVGTVGYCFGGAVVWVAAAQLDRLSCAVSYYGSRILQFAGLTPRVPVLMHAGRHDASFPLPQVRAIAARHATQVTLHEYDAGHGFNCDQRADHVPGAAALARDRTLAFFAAHLE